MTGILVNKKLELNLPSGIFKSLNFKYFNNIFMKQVFNKKGVGARWSSETTKKNGASPKSQRVGVTLIKEDRL
jgi:hypothetical protein